MFRHKVFAFDKTPKIVATAPKGNIVCSHGSLVFVAVGSTVRCADLSHAPDSDSTRQNGPGYAKLGLSLTFEIRSLVLNKSGTLLAMVGDSMVAVCATPSALTIRQHLDQDIKVKARLVGASRPVQISKVIWNPVARYDANLVVLTADAWIRAYDMSNDYAKPELEVCLTGGAGESGDSSGAQKNSFTVDYDTVEDPVSIAFGTGADPQGKLTLYVATASGDIFALCPFAPAKFVLSSAEAQNLFDSCIADQESSHSQTSASVRRRFRDQLSWVAGLWQQLEHSVVESSLQPDGTVEDLHVFRRPDNEPPAVQGPLSCSPYPNVLYEGGVCDLLTLSASPFTVLVLSYLSGRVALFVQNTPLTMAWSDDTEMLDSVGSLATVQCVKLPQNAKGHSLLQAFGSSVYVLLSSGAYELDLSKWAEDQDFTSTPAVSSLTRAATTPETLGLTFLSDKIGQWYSLTVGALDQWAVANGASPQPIRDPATFNTGLDIFGTPSKADLLAVQPRQPEQNSPTSPAIPDSPDLSRISYQTLLENIGECSPDAIVQLLDSVQNIRPPPSRTINPLAPIVPNLANLEYFSILVDLYGEQVAKVQRAGALIHDRVKLQVLELHRQLRKVAELDSQIKDAKAAFDPQSKVDEALTRQGELEARAGKLLQRLAQSQGLAASDKERQWFDELKRLRARVYGNGGLDRRVRTAVAQSEVLSREHRILAARLGGSTGKRPSVTSEDVAGLQEMLDQSTKLIRYTEQAVRSALGQYVDTGEVLAGLESLVL